MRSPFDKQLESPEAASGAEAIRASLPGGKALRRLLQFLVPRGYSHAANLAIEAAVPESDRETTRSRVGISSLPELV
jgi:hypothetical protein